MPFGGSPQGDSLFVASDMDAFRLQIHSLPELIGERLGASAAEAARVVERLGTPARLFVIGCGDSYFAALAAELAFEMIAGVPTEVHNAMSFSRYAAEFVPAEGSLVVGISVSGKVSRTIEGLARARKRGLRTLAITGSTETPIAQVADEVAVTTVSDLPNPDGVQSPGARSYAASLVMLYAIALALAEASGRDVRRWHTALEATAHAAQTTIRQTDERAKVLAEQTRHATEFVFCGSGPNFGTAHFCAAKVVEASGDPALGQDVEEWAHVQYFAKAVDTPTFLITARERDASRAEEVRAAMQAVGRRVVEVAPSEEVELPYTPCPEVFSPLVAAIPGMLFAAHRAALLGEPYFRGFGGGRSIEGGGGASRIRTSQIIV
ncbi:MAG: SIS domain-containing protein [Thermoflexales bacterium]|nr:SIS domain-containing protein [Thermoflexales bacterium]